MIGHSFVGFGLWGVHVTTRVLLERDGTLVLREPWTGGLRRRGFTVYSYRFTFGSLGLVWLCELRFFFVPQKCTCAYSLSTLDKLEGNLETSNSHDQMLIS